MALYPVSRIGDALSGGGVILSSLAPTIIVNTQPIATIGSTTYCPLPGHGAGTIVTSPVSTVLAGDTLQKIATLGSIASCGCTVIEGSENTFASD